MMEDAVLADKLDGLIAALAKENPVLESKFSTYPHRDLEDKFQLYRAFCNERQPRPISDQFIQEEAEVLGEVAKRKGKVSLEDIKKAGGQLDDQVYLWQGDITRLALDGIVNAANSYLLGCTLANHNCIDNAIHTQSGVRLRLACYDLMLDQGRKEAAGKAKITPAFNLPSKAVLHTVGPYIDQRGVTPLKERLLASSYRTCLEVAEANQLKELAFCSISTGEFNYPKDQAAQLASQVVKDYLAESASEINIVFNVFQDEDAKLYRDIWQ